jgi:YidC/Oxa1 family membrane protein insertase
MFELLDFLIVRPIVNILFVIYSVVGDFGVAIIILTILIKLLTWPLMKRQLQQTKLMRKIQPELAEIKKNCKGNRQLESLQMMDLYKRNNIKPFRSVLTIFIQLPIFIALFTAISVSVNPCANTDEYQVNIGRCRNANTEYNVEHSAYPPIRNMQNINTLIDQQKQYFKDFEAAEDKSTVELQFKPKLFGAIDLSVLPSQVFSNPSVSTVVVLIFALASAVTQFIMARQQDPTRQKGKKRRGMKELMKEAADGKEASRDEINAVAQSQTTYMMPIMMLFIMINLPGALVMYYFFSNLITVFIQKIILSKKLEQMEEAADKKVLKELRDATKKIKEAEIVEDKTEVSKTKSTRNASNKNKNSKEDITRIVASDKKKRRK